jgi:hypothetical protein
LASSLRITTTGIVSIINGNHRKLDFHLPLPALRAENLTAGDGSSVFLSHRGVIAWGYSMFAGSFLVLCLSKIQLTLARLV